MAEGVLERVTGLCAKCGNPYRPSPWGREYLCPACGQPLSTPEPRPRLRIPAWLPVAVAAVLLMGAIVRMAIDRARAMRLAAVTPPSLPRPLELPPHFRQHLVQKVALLREDLAVEPTYPPLLVELARTYLALAKVTQEKEPETSRQYLREVSRCISKITETAPIDAGRLEAAMREFRHLVWGMPGEMPGRGLLAPGSPGSLIPDSRPMYGPPPTVRAMPPRPVGSSGPASVSVTPPVPAPPSAPVGVIVPNGPQPGAVSVPAPMPGAPGPLPGGPGPFPLSPGLSNAPGAPGMMFQPGAGPRPPRSPEKALRELRRQVAENPNEVRYADRLGLRLIQEGYRARREPGDGEERCRAYFREARDVYMAGARRCKLRIDKSAFLLQASELYNLLGDADSELRVLQEATRLTPFGVPIWIRLQSAYLRNGMITECRQAREELNEWTLPRLRPPQ